MFYRNKKSFENGKGAISYPIIECSISRWPVSDVEFCMELKTESGIFHLAAPSGSHRMIWINTIRKAIREKIVSLLSKDTKDTKGSRSSQITIINPSIDSLKRKKMGKKRFSLPFPVKGEDKGGVLYKKVGSKYKEQKAELKDGQLRLTPTREKSKAEVIELSLAQEIEMDNIQNDVFIDKENTHMCNVFELTTSTHKVYTLGVSSEEDISEWINNINKEVKRARRKSRA